jgi:hypothetical protein
MQPWQGLMSVSWLLHVYFVLIHTSNLALQAVAITSFCAFARLAMCLARAWVHCVQVLGFLVALSWLASLLQPALHWWLCGW